VPGALITIGVITVWVEKSSRQLIMSVNPINFDLVYSMWGGGEVRMIFKL
jgi:hypothetical protein